MKAVDEEDFQAMMRRQAFLSRQVVQEARTERKIKLLAIVTALTANRKQIQMATLLHEAESAGFTEDEAYALVDELVKDGFVAEPKQGYLARA